MAQAAISLRHRGEQGGITCIEDLEAHLRLIGRLDLAIEANETEYNIEKQRLKDRYAKRKAELADERQPLLAAVETYVTAHRDELLGKKKAVKLDFGQVGWRKAKDEIPEFLRRGPKRWPH